LVSHKSRFIGKDSLILFLVMFILDGTASSILLSHYAYGQTIDRSNDVKQQLRDPKNIIAGKAILLIYTDTSWSGSILDTTFSSATDGGSGDKRVEFECSSGGIYSMAFQKQESSGYLILAIIQNGKLLNEKATGAEYGVVSLSGHCD
jgi:hypothetical protein